VECIIEREQLEMPVNVKTCKNTRNCLQFLLYQTSEARASEVSYRMSFICWPVNFSDCYALSVFSGRRNTNSNTRDDAVLRCCQTFIHLAPISRDFISYVTCPYSLLTLRHVLSFFFIFFFFFFLLLLLLFTKARQANPYNNC